MQGDSHVFNDAGVTTVSEKQPSAFTVTGIGKQVGDCMSRIEYTEWEEREGKRRGRMGEEGGNQREGRGAFLASVTRLTKEMYLQMSESGKQICA